MARKTIPVDEKPIQPDQAKIQRLVILNQPKLDLVAGGSRSGRLDIGAAEVVAPKQQPGLEVLRGRVGEAIAEIEDAGAAAAEAVALGYSATVRSKSALIAPMATALWSDRQRHSILGKTQGSTRQGG